MRIGTPPRCALAIALALAVLSAPALAQTGPGTPTEQVRLSLERYDRLMRGAVVKDGATVTWGRGALSVVLPGEQDSYLTATVTATVRVVGGKGPAQLVLLPGDVVLEQVRINGGEATLTRRNGAHIALIEGIGRNHTVSLRYLIPVRPGAVGRTGLIPIPPLPASQLTITTGGRDVEVWPGGKTKKQGGTLSVALPSTPAVVLRFDDAGSTHQIRRADHAVTVGPDKKGATVTSQLEVHLRGAKQAVRIGPESAPLVDVREGEKALVTRVRDGWHEAVLTGAGKHTITATFRLMIDRSQGQPKVTLALSRVPITAISATVPGKRMVTLEPAVPLETVVTGEKGKETTTAKGFLPPTSSAVVRWTESRPIEKKKEVRVNSATYQLVSISEGVIKSKVEIRYRILRGKVKSLPIRVPSGVVLYKVEGPGIEDWHGDKDDPGRVTVYLGREIEGNYKLTLELEANIPKKEGAPLDIPVVRPLGQPGQTGRETGVVALFDGEKVGFAPAGQTTYTAVGQDMLPMDIQKKLKHGATQTYKHIGAPGAMTSAVSKVQLKEVLYDARSTALYSVKEGAIGAHATVQVDVKSGLSDRIVLSLPKNVTILLVTASGLSKKGPVKGFAEKGRQGYELRFAKKVNGVLDVHLEFELVLKTGMQQIALPDIRVVGAEVEEGTFGITAETGIEVKEAKVDKLRRVDANELPRGVSKRKSRNQEILVGYTYAHTPWALTLDVKRHETVETLTAAIQAAWLETTVFEDGHIVTRAVFSVKNEDRQFLRVQLPPGSKVWSVSADGAPTKAVADESGRIAIKMHKRKVVPVELVYEIQVEALSGLGSLDFLAPKTDALVTNLQWLLRLPQKFTVHDVETTMEQVDPSEYKKPELPGSSAGRSTGVPREGEVQELLFTVPVNNADEDAPKLTVSYVDRPGDWAGTVLWILGLLLLVAAAWRRAASRGRAWIAIVLGLGLLAAKVFGWGFDESEAMIAIGAILAAAIAGYLSGRRQRRAEERSE